MEYALADITATRALENVTDFAQYGLDESQSVISYTTADGASVEILTGDYNDVSGEYYAQLAGEHTVYTVSGDYMEDFQYTIDDLLQVESLPIYEEDTELRVTADGKTTVYDLTKNAGDETDETDADTGDSTDSDETSSEAEEDGDTVSTAQEIVDGVRGLNFETCVTYKADKVALASYDLDKPQMSFTVKGRRQMTAEAQRYNLHCRSEAKSAAVITFASRIPRWSTPSVPTRSTRCAGKNSRLMHDIRILLFQKNRAKY